MNTDQRDALVPTLTGNSNAPGLEIFNTDTKCVETWNGSKWIQTCPPEGPRPKEEIRLTIKTTAPNEIYYIPTSGGVGNTYNHAYDWNVYFDDDNAVHKTRNASTIDHNGIEHTFPVAGDHKIRITPFNPPAPGWGNAFGHHYSTTGNANSDANKQKLISIDAPLTTMVFAPQEEAGNTSASYMFAYMFSYCTNLITPAKFVDTYQLPSEVTDLSYFLYCTHNSNTKLTSPIDLSGLKGWLYDNKTITNLSNFLYGTHSENAILTSTIDLSPLKDWFKENESIVNLSYFLGYTHSGNARLITSIDLSGLSGWFKGNTSIESLSYFLAFTHAYSDQLASPIDLDPIKGWFIANNDITDLSYFLNDTYLYNYSLKFPVDLTPLAGWFNNNTSIQDLTWFLVEAHYNNTSLTSPIDLIPLRNWFNTLGHSIANLEGFLSHTHYENTALDLTGQSIFPDWIQNLTESGKPIYRVDAVFQNMFGYDNPRYEDTAEPTFEDGTTYLSQLGEPTYNVYTYANRYNINPYNNNWK
ncbi:MAG: hypothetical protein LBS54_02640 [Dysgonamonadaceae bacterium]|jgi:hypothetical protein|nr:hypothetical protein [Dysgonamonadaceae bacterium]